ncbi:hypothetical protein KDA_33260 [Dictyobacter alpinus]|uniref:EfeO-type cupredoxin-like domain-containing protein n=1 Tax=Dictyobacter alpinus TaxID=2014873 RepID=A0A402B962_9CHLR|nr:hypothetical protein [Dictyobacter alpinus]GCE27842.1 hypothetical protein KDA_33260 [Dictyobacter alpinus]
MRRLQFWTSILFLLLVGTLSACGGDSGSTASNTSGTNSSNASTSKDPQEVRIVMGEMYFKLPFTTFKVGQPYKFIIVNEGKNPHEFTIAPPRKAGQNEKDEDTASLLDADQIAGGQSKTLDVFTFKKPAPAGTLEIECSYSGHYEGGMHTPIVVEA